MFKHKTPVIAAILALGAGPVLAQTATTTTTVVTEFPAPAQATDAELASATTATAATDLNLRAGPGPAAEILGVIAADDTVELAGCLDTANWCKVTYDGTTGWAYGDYLQTKVEDEVVYVYPNRQQIDVETVTYDEDGSDLTSAGIVGAAGAAAGAIIGGPAAIAAGALVGAAGGAAANPDPEVVTYVRQHPVQPVYLSGEAVVGAGIPDTVELAPIPESEAYSYIYMNGQPVIVNSDREIVQIIR